MNNDEAMKYFVSSDIENYLLLSSKQLWYDTMSKQVALISR